jgi:hypothetical protein
MLARTQQVTPATKRNMQGQLEIMIMHVQYRQQIVGRGEMK